MSRGKKIDLSKIDLEELWKKLLQAREFYRLRILSAGQSYCRKMRAGLKAVPWPP